MKEINFLNKNSTRWKEFESILFANQSKDVDQIADLFIQLTDDLSFAKTYFPDTKTTKYLNQLLSRAHQIIYKNKKEKRNRFVNFWTTEVPLTVRACHKQMLYSFIIFAISILVGIVSSANDDTFVRLILGDSYVNMTLANIEKGDPMAVYKEMRQTTMFLGISINNIKVSFVAFLAGILLSFGTGFILFKNGVMLGAFQYFFFQEGLLTESVLTIWIHGTLEISAIIIAGGAGIVLGNSILFPGTFSRKVSFINGAKKGLKIVIGLMPIFLIAAFLEGFVTRHTEMPSFLSLAIILISLIFIVWYFIIYPIKLSKNLTNGNNTN